MITKTKNELEKRLQTTVIEKETIFASLEEALDRIHTLERHVREQDNKLKVSFFMAESPTRHNNEHSGCLISEHDATFGSCATGELFAEREISKYRAMASRGVSTN